MSALYCPKCGVPMLEKTMTGLCEECFQWSLKPDGLSKRKRLFGVPFEDLKHLDEDERIKQIVGHVKRMPGKVVAFMVDKSPEYQGKGDRWIEKIKALLPGVKIKDRYDGPVKNVETIHLTL